MMLSETVATDIILSKLYVIGLSVNCSFSNSKCISANWDDLNFKTHIKNVLDSVLLIYLEGTKLGGKTS